MNLWRITSLMTFLLLLLAGPPSRAQQAPLAGLDDYVTKAMKDWGVPGLAIAVIKDDRIVLAKGYGVRELGKPETMNALEEQARAAAAKLESGRVTGTKPSAR